MSKGEDKEEANKEKGIRKRNKDNESADPKEDPEKMPAKNLPHQGQNQVLQKHLAEKIKELNCLGTSPKVTATCLCRPSWDFGPSNCKRRS